MGIKSENDKKSHNALYLSRKAAGICTHCGTVPARENKITCELCNIKLKQHAKKKQESRKLQEVCHYCGSDDKVFIVTEALKYRKIETHNHFSWYCEVCYFKKASSRMFGTVARWQELQQKLIDQNFVCPYTGEKLILGHNASLDHIYPKSRFPEYQNDIDNLEWITLDVNLMKRDNTKDEFLAILHTIFKQVGK